MVMRRTISILLAAMVLAGPAMAEPPTGSRLGNHTVSGLTMTPRDAAIATRAMGACMYNRHEEGARAVLLAPTKAEEEKASKKVTGEVTCFNAVFANDMVAERRVTIPHEILRGMLAERALEIAQAQVAMLPSLPLQRIYERSWFAVTGRNVAVDELGACIADINPAGIAALVGAEPESKAESAAFAALNDSLGKCLRAGVRLQANRQSLRAALADALYQRLARPPEPAPAGSTTEAAK
jgi:hypothetical protein